MRRKRGILCWNLRRLMKTRSLMRGVRMIPGAFFFFCKSQRYPSCSILCVEDDIFLAQFCV